ncbi:MAG TPA: polysaccharide biosynthesis protein [Actinomycetes bacterium]|jgi:FlaA1/EpsC-like NDP-sugar epimerase|nr:polysaccharide biosynthesis protein [Actinomycetes bacterium]
MQRSHGGEFGAAACAPAWVALDGATAPVPAARQGLRCLIVGAGEAGRAIARDLVRTPDFGLRPIGFLDDDPAAPARARPDLPVLGTTGDLVAVAEEQAVDVVIVAIPSLPTARIRSLARAAAAAGVGVRYLPTFVAPLERDARLSDLRRLRVDRLLGRDELRVVRRGSRALVEGKRVLVTGAGGSIGSELCRQIAAFSPAALYLLDHDESNLHGLRLELHGKVLLDGDEPIIADVRDGQRVRQLFHDLRPQVVFHAAAHKHLPLLERHPGEGVKSNVLGTLHLAQSALLSATERFILISTDKAADPSSILGVTKRLAEMICQACVGGATRFASVRFGNVLGSRGSFLSVLSEQIANGEPVTVTHPEVTRFFMTVEEAVGLVIEAGGMAEHGEVFVLDMGEPVRIVDLVRNYAAQVRVASDDVAIRYTGLRPGEKLTEALFSEHEQRTPTGHPKVWSTATSTPVGPEFLTELEPLLAATEAGDPALVRRRLSQLVPEYTPSPTRS